MTYSKLRWRDLTQNEWLQLPKDRTTVILTLGPMEPHGPHLPLGTDLLLAEHLSLHLVSRMAQEDPLRTFLWDDTLALGIDPFHGNGVLESRPSLVKKILEHRVAQIARHGFSEIWIMNMHGSPRHLVVTDEVCEKARWKHRTTGVYSITAQLMSAFLDKELQSKFKLYLQSKKPFPVFFFREFYSKRYPWRLDRNLITFALGSRNCTSQLRRFKTSQH